MIDKIEEFVLKILRKIKLGKLADIYEEHKEGMRYLIFGVLTTLVNIVVSAIMYYLVFVKLPEEIKVNLSTIIAIIAAWIFAYVTNKLYVFDSKTNNKKELIKEIISFISCRGVTAIVEIVLMNIFVTMLQFNYILMKIIVNIIIIVLNFIFSKLFIFKKKVEKELWLLLGKRASNQMSVCVYVILITCEGWMGARTQLFFNGRGEKNG